MIRSIEDTSTPFQPEIQDALKKKKYFRAFVIIAMSLTAIHGIYMLYIGQVASLGLFSFGIVAVYFSLLILANRGHYFNLLVHVFTITNAIVIFKISLLTGIIFSPVFAFSIFIPLIPLLLINRNTAFYYMIGMISLMLVATILSSNDLVSNSIFWNDNKYVIYFIIFLSVVFIAYYYILIFDNTKKDVLNSLNEKNLSLDEARNKLVAANQNKDKLLANVSHEFRNPLHGILNLSAILKEDVLDDEIKNYLDIIGDTGENLLKIINDILDISKIEAGVLDINTQSINLHIFISKLIDLHSIQANHKDLTLHSVIEDNVPELIMADELRLNQVLSNILSNAIKNTPVGHINLTVRNHFDKELVFEIEDTGSGMGEQDVKSIFDRFYQVKGMSAKDGVGLGLTITKSLLHLMNGNIDVHSQLNQGTVFKILIPLLKNDLSSGNDILNENEATSVQIQYDEMLNGLSILAIDDDETNNLIIRNLFEQIPNEVYVDTTNKGSEALQMIRKNSYDVILMDIVMPDMDGNELARKIGSLQLEKKPGIIAATASAMSHELNKYKSDGIDHVISKPFKMDELVRKILDVI